jgi:hypothetical protein
VFDSCSVVIRRLFSGRDELDVITLGNICARSEIRREMESAGLVFTVFFEFLSATFSLATA